MEKPPGMEGMTEKEIERAQRVARQIGRVEDGKLVPSPFPKYAMVALLIILLLIGGLWLSGIVEFKPGD